MTYGFHTTMLALKEESLAKLFPNADGAIPHRVIDIIRSRPISNVFVVK